jgi:pimeloyl-ACP methyl ester carboxylesterase
VDMYIRPFSQPEGRDVLVEHLSALDPDETMALAPRLKDIVAPTSIIWGAHDPYLSPTVGRHLHEAIPGSTLDILADVRHFSPEVAPEQVGTLLAAWLAR